MKELGKLIYVSPHSSLGRRMISIFSFIMTLVLIIFFIYEMMDKSIHEIYDEYSIIPLFVLFAIITAFWLHSDARIRIYKNGFSRPSILTSVIPLWPKPVHLDDMIGYKIERKFEINICTIILTNGKVIKISSALFDAKTLDIFKKVILKQLKRLDKDYKMN